jgi:hypothetical protein
LPSAWGDFLLGQAMRARTLALRAALSASPSVRVRFAMRRVYDFLKPDAVSRLARSRSRLKIYSRFGGGSMGPRSFAR